MHIKFNISIDIYYIIIYCCCNLTSKRCGQSKEVWGMRINDPLCNVLVCFLMIGPILHSWHLHEIEKTLVFEALNVL